MELFSELPLLPSGEAGNQPWQHDQGLGNPPPHPRPAPPMIVYGEQQFEGKHDWNTAMPWFHPAPLVWGTNESGMDPINCTPSPG